MERGFVSGYVLEYGLDHSLFHVSLDSSCIFKVYIASAFEYDIGMFVAQIVALRSVWMSAGGLSTALKVFAHLIGLSSGFFRDQGAGELFGSIVVGTGGGWARPS